MALHFGKIVEARGGTIGGMTMKKFVCLLAFCLPLLFVGCDSDSQKQSPTPQEPTAPVTTQDSVRPALDLGVTADNYPRVDGSTATIPLGEALASLVLDIPRAQCEPYATFSGTTKSYAALMDNLADLLIVYEPMQETVDGKGERGLSWEMTPIGRDALVFLVNKDNPVQSLTEAQLRDIYTGNITNWKELGGEDMEIKAFQRNVTAGSQTMMLKLVMKDTPMMEPPVDFAIQTMEGLIEAIAQYKGTRQAIGYSVYYYAHNMNPNDGLRFMAVDGVEPTNETIKSGAYPFVNDFYAVIRADEPADSPARRLYNFLCGDDGQALVSREGYVSAR